MFVQYFGGYLVEKNLISHPQLELILKQQKESRVKLGTIAIAEKLLTKKQADEINELQKVKDMRFGDIAIKKGYLLKEEVNFLLGKQRNPYMKLLQTLTERNIMTMDEIEDTLEDFREEYNLTASELDALLADDIDLIIPIFTDVNVPVQGELVTLFIKNIVRFINNNIMLKQAYTTNQYSFGNLAYQQVIGDYSIFVGLASQENELLLVANPFAGEEFTEMNEDAFDSVCEFINCINGLYASKLSLEEVQVDMTPPLHEKDKNLFSQGGIYVVPITINNKRFDLLVVLDDTVDID